MKRYPTDLPSDGVNPRVPSGINKLIELAQIWLKLFDQT